MRLGKPLGLAVAGMLALAGSAGAHTLRSGGSAFWDGRYIESGAVSDASTCGDQCPVYDLFLADPAKRLRVAIDTAERTDQFTFEVIDPAGVVRTSASNSNQFNEEAFVSDPLPGAWKVRVLPTKVEKARFRMRAKLEGTVPARPTGKVAVLPNLKSVPPMEFGFIAPANPANGLYPPDDVNPPLDVGGVHPVSCTADEMAPKAAGGFEAKECLRLTSGPINVGAGEYDMRFALARDLTDGTADPVMLRGPMIQRVHYGDGTTQDRPSGTYSFHTTHGHFHDDGILTYELYRVIPDTGASAVTVPGVAEPVAVPGAEPGAGATPRAKVKAKKKKAKKRKAKAKKRKAKKRKKRRRVRARKSMNVADLGPAPKLVKAGQGTKSGFCPADQLFGEWEKFRQQPSGTFGTGDSAGGNCFSPTDGVLGLSVGWGDVYRWQRPGQYVEFAGQPDAIYVLRTIVDKSDEVLEENETDNSAYALISVTGEKIETHQRGQGTDPWDPAAEVFRGTGPAQR